MLGTEDLTVNKVNKTQSLPTGKLHSSGKTLTTEQTITMQCGNGDTGSTGRRVSTDRQTEPGMGENGATGRPVKFTFQINNEYFFSISMSQIWSCIFTCYVSGNLR